MILVFFFNTNESSLVIPCENTSKICIDDFTMDNYNYVIKI